MKKLEIVVLLHNIRSIHNVASMFRTADAAGVKKIYLCGITPGPLDRFGKILPQFAKVSLGAEKSVKWEKVKDTSKLIDTLRKDGYKILAVEQSKKSIPYYRFQPFGSAQGKNKLALIFGNEVRGLPASILKKSDKILEIPMSGVMVRQAHHPRHSRQGKESLNISVAFGIIIYSLLFSL